MIGLSYDLSHRRGDKWFRVAVVLEHIHCRMSEVPAWAPQISTNRLLLRLRRYLLFVP